MERWVHFLACACVLSVASVDAGFTCEAFGLCGLRLCTGVEAPEMLFLSFMYGSSYSRWVRGVQGGAG